MVDARAHLPGGSATLAARRGRANRRAARRARVRSRKFSMRRRPCRVLTDSGWNCTPNNGRSWCSSPMITPSGVHALTRRSAGTAPTTSEW